MFSPTDTIVAIATPPGRGAIGVVRVSGPGARRIAARILTAAERLAPRVATFTHAIAARAVPPASGEPPAGTAANDRETPRIDQVIATFFPGPGSYTGEDVLEVASHGSPVVLRTVVEAAVAAGARLAEPGEFTLRAFLNDRVDLVQAEAVADLVDSVTPLQARAAFDQLEGTLTGAIGRIDGALFDVMARLEASIDFPDEGYHFVQPGEVDLELARIEQELEELLRDGRRGRVVREGRQVVIAGKPNVGKSTLFNRLVGSERAIVTPIAGTTRDLVTETTDLDGLRVCFVDTAGVREAGDLVESEGVRRAMGAAAIADLVVVVLDRSRPLDGDDVQLLAATDTSDRLVLVNKIDLDPAWEMDALERAAERAARGAVLASLATGDGVTDVKHRLAARLLGADRLRDVPAVTNVRHITLLGKAAEALGRARSALVESGGRMPEEFLLADLREAQGALEEVTGRRTSEDLLRHIFARFCVGK